MIIIGNISLDIRLSAKLLITKEIPKFKSRSNKNLNREVKNHCLERNIENDAQ